MIQYHTVNFKKFLKLRLHGTAMEIKGNTINSYLSLSFKTCR